MLTKQNTLMGRHSLAESLRVKEPKRTALPCGSQPQVLWEWDWFQVVFGQSFCLALLDLAQGPSWWRVHLSAKMDSSAKDSVMLVISSLLLVPSKFSQVVLRAAPGSLSGPPALGKFIQMAIIVPGQGG